RDGDERRSAIVVQLRSRGRVPDAGHPAALSDEPRLRGGGPRPASRRAAVSVPEAFRERRAAHQPVSPIVERRRLPLRLHAPQPRVAEGSRRPVRLVDVRHRSVRATARRRTDDLSLLRATRQRQRLRRAAVHAGAGFDAVRRAAGAAERRVEVQARLGRVPRRDGAAQHPPGLHDVRGVAVARGVSRGALSGLPGIRGSSVQQDRVVRTSPGRRAIRARAPVPGVLSCPWHSAAPEREPGRVAVSVYTLDPLGDRRWPAFVDERPDASVFHTPAWLDALRRTYGYAPVVYTTTPPHRPLANGVVFARVSSWLTGRRLVSLPFADHCEPLADAQGDGEILAGLRGAARREGWKYVELRPLSSAYADRFDAARSATFCFHAIDLTPPAEDLFRSLHKNAIQQMVRRAEREGLRYERGVTDALLTAFYRLLTVTRRRHRVPPQPYTWFVNLRGCMGDRLRVHLARARDDRPIAAILTLQHGHTVVYKYGA